METDQGAFDIPSTLSQRTAFTILAASWVAVFLAALDSTIVATLVAPISSSFASANQASWLGTSFLLTIATTTPLYGKLSDIIGRRPSALTALTLFAIGNLLCGLAQSMPMLIAARALAGCGGGGTMALAATIASDIIPLRRRGLLQGFANICAGLGQGLGGPLGGMIVGRFHWRWAFLVQVPPLAVAWILIFIFVRYSLPGQARTMKSAFKQIDWLGSAALILCISGLLLSLSFRNNQVDRLLPASMMKCQLYTVKNLPWSDPKVWATMTTFVVFLVAFVTVEAFVCPNPVMPLRILSSRSTICIAMSNFLLSMISYTVLYYLPILYETVQLSSPQQAGDHLIPNAIALSSGSLLSGLIMRLTGKYYYLNILSAAAPLIGAITMANMDQIPRWTDWIVCVPNGIGIGSNVTVLLIALLANVDREDMAVATGISYLFRYCGQVVGVGVAGSVMQSILTSQLRARITGPGSGRLIDQIRLVPSSISDLAPDIRETAVDSYHVALRLVFAINGGLACLNTIASLFIEEHTLSGTLESEQKLQDERKSSRRRNDLNTPSDVQDFHVPNQ
ncbi:MAG: hypothetical protein CYPHOPRED_000485 [Cyphobasidiales sp. Tagirdzhanova-0007]|nr:MAG: hypothetical protein CYPHOPRED_000485 [Cyphobasidiales sp. Tagirdzhanova-0007]